MNKKIFLAGLLTLASVASVVGTVGNAREVEAAAPTTVYLDPACWDASSARFAAYFWDTAAATWHNMSDSDGDGIFEVKVPANCSKVIFCRMNKTSTANNWNNKWNQSNDLTIPTDGKNLYTISGWGGDKSPGSWGTYIEPGVSLMGTLTDWTGGTTMTKQSNGTYTLDLTVDTVAEYKLKVKIGYTWIGDGTLNVKGLTLKTTDTDKNIIFDAAKGTYHFEFVMSSKTLNVTFTAAPDYDADINDLFEKYYNKGTYTKYSVLNTNKIADEEVKKEFFHAGADIKYRKTEYTPDGLKMTTKDTENGEYTNDSIYKNEDGKVVHTGVGGDYTVNKESVEAWFVTLEDFVNASTTGWEYENGVYSHNLVSATATEEDDLTTMAREFVAPMWLAPNAKNYTYASFTKLTVEEVSNTLVMKLYVHETNRGILVEGSNDVFSQVTISL